MSQCLQKQIQIKIIGVLVRFKAYQASAKHQLFQKTLEIHPSYLIMNKEENTNPYAWMDWYSSES